MTGSKASLIQKATRLKEDFAYYAEHCLRIRTKSGSVQSFKLNRAQLYIHERIEKQRRETGRVRAVILKGRQQGCSTYTEGRFYWLASQREGMRAFILTHEQEATLNLFEMARRYHENCPKFIRPSTKVINVRELTFDRIDSGYKVGTAGTQGVGRSQTVQLFHGSEVAFWQHAADHAKGVLQAVPLEDGTEVILESTANGIGNYYHQQWQLAESGQSDFIAIFVPWFWQDEYRRPTPGDFVRTDEEDSLADIYGLDDEQLEWRRKKIVELASSGGDGAAAFRQEYPCTPTEAFQLSGDDSLIQPEIVMQARRGEAERYGPVVLGVDPARYGDDRTAIVRRQGRVAWGLEYFEKKDTMEVVGLVHLAIQREKPDAIFVDVGGLGAGVVDRLREMGYEHVVPVNGGGSPLDADLYLNKRAEMWGELARWLKEPPVVIPDSDELHGDLCAPSYKYDSKTRLVLEKKEDMKKRGLRSPDGGDALALTFAFPAAEIVDRYADERHYDYASRTRSTVTGY